MNRKNIYYWLLLPVLALMMGACSESNDNEEPDNADTHVTPVNPGDWQTVPATGGTIEKGDIALTFPAGTFSSDTKVAITEVKKGSVGGECEVSRFYQLTVRNATNKPFTVKMKANKTDDGQAEFVIQFPAYSISQCSNVTVESAIETKYTNGEYTASIPALDEVEDDKLASMTIGLCRNPYKSTAETRATTRDDDQLEGQIGNVKWTLKINYWSKRSEMYKTMKGILPTLKTYIEEAISTIHDLGILMPDSVTLHYQVCSMKSYGCFDPGWRGRDYDRICIQDEMLTWVGEEDLARQTVIHETLHNYQSYYHPGATINPWYDNNAMYEIGAIWIEKFANNGELNGEYQLKDAGLHTTFNNNFRNAMPYNGDEVMALYTDFVPYAEMGYAYGPLLYYMIRKNYSRGFTDKVIASLYTKYWKKTKQGYTLIEVLNEWYTETFKEKFFDGTDNINNYYLALWKGELMKDFKITLTEPYLKGGKADYLSANTKISFQGTVYPYGCEGLLFKMDKNSVTDSQLKKQEMVIKQDVLDIKTYLLYTDGDKILQYPKTAMKDDSVCISSDFIADLHKRNGYNTTFFLLNVKDRYSWRNEKNLDNVAYKSATSVELRVAQNNAKIAAYPSPITFEAEGGQQTVKVDKKNYRYCGGIVDDCEDWVSIVNGSDDTFTVKAKANNTGEERTGTIYAFATNTTNPTAADIELLPIKVTQKAKTVKEGWVLVKTEAIAHEDTSGDHGEYMHYSASETELRKEGKVLGAVGLYRDERRLFDLCFVAKIQAPPTTLNAGDTLRIHITAERTTEATIDEEYNNVAHYTYSDIVMWWNRANSSGYFGIENLVGPKGGPSSFSTESISSWDFVYRVPSGSKGREESVYLQGCGSRVIWTYRWYTPSD